MTNRADIIFAESSGDVAALIGNISHDDASIRALTLGALDRLGHLDDALVVEALRDDDRDVRCRAIEIAIPRRSLSLLSQLRDPDDLVVETASWAMGEREDDSHDTVDALVDVGLHHDVSICREAAIAALGAIGSTAGLPAILAGLSDRAPVRRRAVLALAPFDSPEVTAALEEATRDRDRQVRQAAEDLL